MRRITWGIVMLSLVGAAAQAADLPSPPSPALVYSAPPVIAYFTWTGCYLGGNVGGAWASRDWNDQIPGDPLFGTDLGSYNTSGALGGAQAGCNYQIGNWVVGLQGDYAWSNASGSNSSGVFATLAPLVTLTDQSRLQLQPARREEVGQSGWAASMPSSTGSPVSSNTTITASVLRQIRSVAQRAVCLQLLLPSTSQPASTSSSSA